MTDAARRILYVNAAFGELMGYPLDELVGSSIARFIRTIHRGGKKERGWSSR